MYNVSCILFNKCLYVLITWLDTFWTDLVFNFFLFYFNFNFKEAMRSASFTVRNTSAQILVSIFPNCVTLGRSYYLSVLISQTIKKIEIVLSNLFFLRELLWKASEKMAIEHLVSYNKTLLKQ